MKEKHGARGGIDEAMGGAVVVLSRTTHPGNIGFCARAMKTMGATEMRLAAPRAEINATATANASSATDVLENSRVFQELPAALEGCCFALAFTARRRHLSVEHCDLPAAAAKAAKHLRKGRKIALLLGNEKMGLSNEEALLADLLVEIPSSPSYPSLNISHALQVGLYELRRQLGEHSAGNDDDHVPASIEHREQMFEHFERVSQEIGMSGQGDPRPFMTRLRRILIRASLDRDEVSMLRGFLAATEKRANRKN